MKNAQGKVQNGSHAAGPARLSFPNRDLLQGQSLAGQNGALAPTAIAWASQYYGMSACISATSLIYLLVGLLLLWGVRTVMRKEKLPASRQAT